MFSPNRNSVREIIAIVERAWVTQTQQKLFCKKRLYHYQYCGEDNFKDLGMTVKKFKEDCYSYPLLQYNLNQVFILQQNPTETLMK
jgi:hypothetical protein